MASHAAPSTARPHSAAGTRLAPIHAPNAPAAAAAISAVPAAVSDAAAAAPISVSVPPSLIPSSTPSAPLPASPTSLSRHRSPKSRVGTRRGSTVSEAGSVYSTGGFNFAQAQSSTHSAAALSMPAAPCASCAARRFHSDDGTAASSVDEYLRLQNTQSSRGLEVVYGLKIELSRFLEELADRFPCASGPGSGGGGSSFQALNAPTAGIVPGIPALPYRVVGHGGIEYWADVRAGKIKPPTSEDEDAHNSNSNSRDRALDPFSTQLPSFSAPPPPLTPESVLPSYVLLSRLKRGVRQTINAMEDGLDELRGKLRASEQAREELQAKLERITAARGSGVVAAAGSMDFQSFDAGTGMMVALSPIAAETAASAADLAASGATSSRHRAGSGSNPGARTRSRSRSRSRVQFATDEFVNTSVQAAAYLEPPSSSASAAAALPVRRDSTSSIGEGGGFASAAQIVFNRTPAGQNSVSNRITNQEIARQAGADSARDLSARSAGSSAMDSFRSLPSSGNIAREEALSSALSAAEASLVRWKARARSLADAAHLAELAHTKELSALSQQLHASKLRVSDDAKVLTQRNVLLQLERIARRERQKQLGAQHAFFASALADYTREIKALFSTREQRLFVRKAPNPVPQPQQQQQSKDNGSTNILVLHDASTPKRGASAAASRKKSLAGAASAARTPGGASTPALLPADQPSAPATAETKEESGSSSGSTALVRVNPILGVPDADGLYPSHSSPLTALERSAKTPAGARWLGKLLSPAVAGMERDTLVVASASITEKKAEVGPLQGHLVPGADALALDILLVIDALFLLEYTALSASSVAHSRDLKFRTELEARRTKLEQQGTEDNLQGYLKGGGTGVTIANQTGLTSFGPGGEPIAAVGANTTQQDPAASQGGVNDTREWLDGAPSPAALSALIASIPAQSLAYLQALQKMFLTLWARLPASVQTKFVKVKQSSPAGRAAAQQQQQAATESATQAPPPVDLLNPRLREAIQSQTVNGTPVAASSAAAAAADKDDAAAPGNEDATAAAAVAAVAASPAVVAATSAVTAASHRAALRLQFLVDDLRLAHTLGAGPPSANTVGEHHRRANLTEPRQQTMEHSEEGFGNINANVTAASAADKTHQNLSSDGFTSALVRLSDAPTSTAGKVTSSLPVPPLVDSFAPDSGAPSPADVSLYLARLELILHKVQSLANFRGVMMQM